ncbi:MAG TPA: hypothetical protein VNN20_12315 [Thermodesulfobacteriota bacterium]|nr:hypothetical protein [Thermodesulfobacteriota bacterium]
MDVKAKSVKQRIFGLGRFKAVRKGICILTAVMGLGALDLTLSSWNFQEAPLNLAIDAYQILDDSTEEQYPVYENYSRASVSTKVFHERSTTTTAGIGKTYFNNPNKFTFFDSVNPSLLSFYASFPLRSPPFTL